jgi:hypothetical protein
MQPYQYAGDDPENNVDPSGADLFGAIANAYNDVVNALGGQCVLSIGLDGIVFGIAAALAIPSFGLSVVAAAVIGLGTLAATKAVCG